MEFVPYRWMFSGSYQGARGVFSAIWRTRGCAAVSTLSSSIEYIQV
jgi:hypothetical protein